MTDRIEHLKRLLGERIVLLDGSWGVLIQRDVRGEEAYRGERFRDHPRDVAGDPDLLNLTRPEVILDIHRRYFAAGANIATTNTFTATRIGQADYGLEAVAAEMSLEGARLARRAADEVGGFVAGSLGPLNVSLSVSPKVDDRGLPPGDVRPGPRDVRRADHSAARRRGRPADVRDDLRHAECEGGDRRGARRRAGACRGGSPSRRSTRAAATCRARRSRRSGRRSSTPSR